MSKKKILIAALSVCIIAILAVGGTLAYFTDSEAAANTFTIGKVDIKLKEAKFDALTNGTKNLKVSPGEAYTKDPTIKVSSDSENCWLIAEVVISNKSGLYKIRSTSPPKIPLPISPLRTASCRAGACP